MKKKLLYIVTTVVFVVGLCILYYYYPRKVSFEFVEEIDKPNESFDNSQWFSYHYIQNEERFIYFLTDYYKQRYPPQQGYDSTYAYNIVKNLDYEFYDYIIVYQKKLKDLQHSPYLTKTADGLYFDKRTPLIPTWDSVITDKVYIYRIKKKINSEHQDHKYW
ncbi:MAG: hypothetical protein ACOXZH_04030 [Bacteroidales bacterium]|jgi:hypothetical protein|nr:hypothetical protein [Bacteroidales bacterium]